MISFTDATQAVLLAAALSLDAFVASFGYGVNKIHIPPKSAHIINLICTGILAAAMFIGAAARALIPQPVATGICFAILLLMGAVKLFDSIIKKIIRRKKIERDIRFKFLSLNFILHVYADPEEADLDASRVLSVSEAAYLAVALSLDGLGVGFGAGLASAHPLPVVLLSLAFGFAAIVFGCYLGKKVTEKLKLDLSWLSGAILIMLAVMKLLG